MFDQSESVTFVMDARTRDLLMRLFDGTEINDGDLSQGREEIDEIVQAVEEIVRQGVQEIGGFVPQDDQPLVSAGLDSLGSIELVNLLARRFGISLSPTLVFDHPSINAIVAFIRSKLKGSEEETKQSRSQPPRSDFHDNLDLLFQDNLVRSQRPPSPAMQLSLHADHPKRVVAVSGLITIPDSPEHLPSPSPNCRRQVSPPFYRSALESTKLAAKPSL